MGVPLVGWLHDQKARAVMYWHLSQLLFSLLLLVSFMARTGFGLPFLVVRLATRCIRVCLSAFTPRLQ
jgi:hypothetical protein